MVDRFRCSSGIFPSPRVGVGEGGAARPARFARLLFDSAPMAAKPPSVGGAATERGLVRLEQSRQLRRNMTPAERRLWTVLRRKQLAGFRFRRQAPIGPFVADFFCPKARLIVEVDGGLHSEESHMRRDHERTEWLEAHGCRVFRVWNRDVLQRTDDIADAIYRALTAPLPPAIRPPDSALRFRGCAAKPLGYLVAAAGTFPHASGGKETRSSPPRSLDQQTSSES